MDHSALYSIILDNLEDGVYFVDPERRITVWNPAAERITGFAKEEILGSYCQDNLLNHIDTEGRPLCLLACPLYATLGDGKPRTDEVLLRHKDGHRVAVLVKIIPMFDEAGKITGAVEIFTPQSKAVFDTNLVDSLSSIAMTDQLTGLPNRKMLESFLEYKFMEFRRFGSRFSVAWLALDDFAAFARQHGRHIADGFQRKIAKTVEDSLREYDKFGRWDDGVFVGLFVPRHESDLPAIAQRLQNLVAKSAVEHGDRTLATTASVGITWVRETDTVESVLQRAALLMQEARSQQESGAATL